jgi:putative ABC transport system permease protein
MYYLYFIMKNLGRKKVRTILTCLSIVIAFLLFGLLRTLGSAFDQGAELAGEDRLVTINKITLIQPLPYNYLTKVKMLDTVAIATQSNWFGGYYQEPRNRFSQFAIEADDYFSIYEDLYSLPEDQMKAWKANRIGVVIGKALVDQYQWKIGDRIPLIGMFPQQGGNTTWEFEVSGIYEAKTKGAETNVMLMHYSYFDEARQYGKGTLGWMIIKVKDKNQSELVAKQVDALFANSATETKTSSEKDFTKSFAKQFADIGFITSIILAAVFFTMLLVAGNTMAQSFRERIPELAVLKTLGFADATVMWLVLGEAIFLSVVGGLIGLLFAWLIVAGAADTLAATLPGLMMTMDVLIQGLLFVILFGIVTGAIPAIQGLRLQIVTALRSRR